MATFFRQSCCKPCEFTHHDLGFQFVDLLLPVIQLLSCLISLKLGLSLKLVKRILKCPMLLQKLLPLQPGMKMLSHEHINILMRPQHCKNKNHLNPSPSTLLAALLLFNWIQTEGTGQTVFCNEPLQFSSNGHTHFPSTTYLT